MVGIGGGMHPRGSCVGEGGEAPGRVGVQGTSVWSGGLGPPSAGVLGLMRPSSLPCGCSSSRARVGLDQGSLRFG